MAGLLEDIEDGWNSLGSARYALMPGLAVAQDAWNRFVPKAPEYPGGVPIDANTQGLMNNQFDRAKRTPAQIQAGMEENMGLANQLGARAPTGGSPVNSAIEHAYSKQARDQVDQVREQNAFAAKVKKSADLQKSFQNFNQIRMNQLQSQKMMTEAYNQAEMARAQLISGLFNVGSQAAGAYFGSQAGKAKKPSGYESSSLMPPEIGSQNSYQPKSYLGARNDFGNFGDI